VLYSCQYVHCKTISRIVFLILLIQLFEPIYIQIYLVCKASFSSLISCLNYLLTKGTRYASRYNCRLYSDSFLTKVFASVVGRNSFIILGCSYGGIWPEGICYNLNVLSKMRKQRRPIYYILSDFRYMCFKRDVNALRKGV